MAIIPNGRRRVSKEAQSLDYQKTKLDGSDIFQGVAQDPAENVGPATDFKELQNQLQQPSAKPEVPDMSGLDDGESRYEDNMGSDSSGSTDSGEEESLRQYYFGLLEKLGVPPRSIKQKADQVFQAKRNLSNGSISGTFVIPEYVNDRKISDQEADKMAKDIASRYGLEPPTAEHKKNNHFYAFRTVEEIEDNSSGTSLDLLGGSDNKPSQKAAKTQAELIKESRYTLLKEMSKRGSLNENQ